ncbi:hypothetical protein LTR53_006718 [Teratosphaeriaceae sp. CCFEE 6253]|nr:hypothetical protein LTR53_006718 [Teratosphaeriaceae sp. CCFEE 6253]
MPQLTWLVTGCSTGFGEQFIRAILARGDRAIATARNVASLQPLADLGAATLQLDVTASLDELQKKVQQAVEVYGHIDVLISNAGYVQLGAVEDLGDNLMKQLQTNTFGALNMLKAIMPHWRARKSGFFVVNSSYISWWSTMPGGGAYAASKAALDRTLPPQLSPSPPPTSGRPSARCQGREANGRGHAGLVSTFVAETAALGYIKTLTIHPGHFRSEVAAEAKHAAFLAKPSEHYQGLTDFMTGFRGQLHGHQPGDVVKAVELTLDLVKGEGVAAGGRKVPERIWMGKDAYETVKEQAEETLRVLEEWKEEIQSTDG